MYDFIGDVHGEAKALIKLLDQLGYRSHRGLFRNPDRKAIFVGDLINRGEAVSYTHLDVYKRQRYG